MRKVDYTGMKIGGMKILRQTGVRVNQSLWAYKCNCGFEGEIASPVLRDRMVPRPETAWCPECSSRRTFLSHVDFVYDKDSCWVYKGTIENRSGYGSFVITHKGRRFGSRAHRLMYILVHQMAALIDNKKLLACHRCDNRPCCRPSHIFLGDHSANMKDAWNKGRGKRPRRRKLTDEQINEIRYLSNFGCITMRIARHYKLKPDSVRDIISGKSNRITLYAPPSDTAELNKLAIRLREEKRSYHLFSDTEAAVIKSLFRFNHSNKVLADQFGVEIEVIRRIRTGRTYKNVVAV